MKTRYKLLALIVTVVLATVGVASVLAAPQDERVDEDKCRINDFKGDENCGFGNDVFAGLRHHALGQATLAGC